MLKVKKGQIYYADLSPVIGSEQGGLRPVCIASNDKGNAASPVVIVAPITSATQKRRLPTQFIIRSGAPTNVRVNSMVMCEQLRTIDKDRLKFYIGELAQEDKETFDNAIRASFEV
jgi:mRNA interferase MazF